MASLRLPEISAWHIIIFSFACIISLGTILLSLEVSQATPLPLIDVFFTAASCTCVTGLATVPISAFTPFGHLIILALIQIGGLGLITLTFFIASLFLNLGLATRVMAGEILDFQFWNRIRQFLILIVTITLACEAIGAIVLFSQLGAISSFSMRSFYAIFHAISAFCNAGISLFENNMIPFRHSPITLLTLSFLMLAGSIGFIVWYDLAKITRGFINSLFGHYTLCKMTLHTRIALFSSLILIGFGAYVFWQLEHTNSLADLGNFEQVINSIFMAICARGPGFTTVPIIMLTPSILCTFCLLMFIGASPGSTGSGIKTTTFVLFGATILTIVRNRTSVELGGRRIPHDQVFKVMAIVALAMLWVFCAIFVLLIAEKELIISQGWQIFDIIFETISAFGTCGLSTGITPHLSALGKYIIVGTMFVGRVGSITLALALRHKPEKVLYQYPEERIMIG